MGGVKRVSSFENINRDYGVSFTKEETAKKGVPYNQTWLTSQREGPRKRVLQERRWISSTPIQPRPRTRHTGRRLQLPDLAIPKAVTRMAWSTQWRGSGITIATAQATSSTQRHSTWPPRAQAPRAAPGKSTREDSALLRSWNADRQPRSASAESSAAQPRLRQMDTSQWHPGIVAEVPRVPGRLLCDWNRGRDLNVDRDLP
jgi:hypothetical protein